MTEETVPEATIDHKKKQRPLPKGAAIMENEDRPDQPVSATSDDGDVDGDNEEGEGEGDEEETGQKKKNRRKQKITMADFHPDVKPVVRRAKQDFCAMMAADNMYPSGVELNLIIQGAWDRSNQYFYPEEAPFELTENAKTIVR